MLDKLASLFKKEPEFTDEQIERNQRRVSKIEEARAAAASRAREEAETADSEGRPPPYRTVYHPGSAPKPHPDLRQDSATQDAYSVATLVGRDGKPAVNDNWTAKERRSYGWRAQWHSSVDQLYKENGHYYKRQEGESVGPRRLIPRDHPVYDMSAAEQAELMKKGVDPVTAAEFRRLSRQ